MAERILPQSTAELLDNIDAEWLALLGVIEKLPPEKMAAPDAGGWSPKDNLAHLTEWMKILLGYHLDNRSPQAVTGLPEEVVENWDENIVNRHFFERNRSRSVEDVLAELKRVYGEVVSRLRSTPFEELLRQRYPDDPEKQPLLNWILANTTGHFAEHRENIEKGL